MGKGVPRRGDDLGLEEAAQVEVARSRGFFMVGCLTRF